jgi:cation-transporting ATPase 13A1
MAPLVDNDQIQSAELLRPLPWWEHAYVWPYAIAWPIFLRFYFDPNLYSKYIGASEWTFVWIATITTFQALTWLCTHWSVNLNALFTAYKAKSVEDAVLIKVIPVANAGAADICKLVREKVRVASQTNPGFCPTAADCSISGRRQDQHFVPLPEAPFPLQPRDALVCPADVRP